MKHVRHIHEHTHPRARRDTLTANDVQKPFDGLLILPQGAGKILNSRNTCTRTQDRQNGGGTSVKLRDGRHSAPSPHTLLLSIVMASRTMAKAVSITALVSAICCPLHARTHTHTHTHNKTAK